ncbi:MAG: hypothetical protein HY893_04770 [Deltaproteobacteria bacterium]|nr:hypothetical protein [Deltaproteobacteria bacterium]
MSGIKKYILFLCVILFIPSLARATLTFDSQTSECLSCHKEISVDESRFCAQLNCDHPFAVDYAAISEKNRGLFPPDELPPEIGLMEGRLMGCPTCHVRFTEADHLALSSERKIWRLDQQGSPDPMLVMDNRRNQLCVSCHVVALLPRVR